MKKYILPIFAAIAAFTLIGCNTVDGVGRDFEEAGESMQEAAD